MVETRRARKRRGTNDDVDEEHDNAYVALERASRMRSQKAKQRRIEAHRRKPPFHSIPDDVLPRILLFLDSARDVYSLSVCSEPVRKAITPEIVVRSAVFGSGTTRSTMYDLMEQVKNRSIYVPSTLRLLRLVNGKEALQNDMLETMDASAPADNEARAQVLLNTYEAAVSDFDTFDKARADLLVGKMNNEAAKWVYAKLESLLDGYRFKDMALERAWSAHFGTYAEHFTLHLSDCLLGPLVRDPSHLNVLVESNLPAAVDSLCEALHIVDCNGFMDTDFLGFLRDSTVGYDRALYRYCVAEKTPRILLADCCADEAFLAHLRAGNPLQGLLRVLTCDDLKEAFVHHVLGPRTGYARVKLEKFARLLWSDNTWVCFDLEEYRRGFEERRREFLHLTTVIHAYFADPRTVQFLQETGPPLGNPNQIFSRRNAVDTVYEDPRCLQHLRVGDFGSLLALHRDFFQHPTMVGFSAN